jgi:protein associated with RNAse G/E
LSDGAPIEVKKLKPDGELSFAWTGTVLRVDETKIVLRAEFNVDVVERSWATFRRGDVFVEFYYWDRAYNVFQVSTPEGSLKGWYANVGLPAEFDPGTGVLRYVDLALDVWANPDGSFVVLDQDEFEILLAEYPQFAEAGERGRDTLLRLAESGQLPRWSE